MCGSVGVTGNCILFYLTGWAEQSVSSVKASILISIMPLTSVIYVHFFVIDESLTFFRFLGVLIRLLEFATLIGTEFFVGIGLNTLQ